MQLMLTITLALLNIFGLPALLYAQNFTIDSSQKVMDISAQFNGAEVHLPAVKKGPEFAGGKKAWQDFLRANINITVPIANNPIGSSVKLEPVSG